MNPLCKWIKPLKQYLQQIQNNQINQVLELVMTVNKASPACFSIPVNNPLLMQSEI